MLCAALLNCYGNGRSWIRVARFLEFQGKTDEAKAFLANAAVMIEEQKLDFCFIKNMQASQPDTLKTIKSELDKKKRHVVHKSQVRDFNPESTQDQLKQRVNLDSKCGRSMEALEEEIMACEQFYNVHKMITTLGDAKAVEEAKELSGPTADRILFDHCTDFLQTVAVPDGLNKSYVRKVLYWSYVRYRTDPWARAMQWRMSWSGKVGSDKKIPTDKDELFKRWHGSYPLKVIFDDPAKYAKVRSKIISLWCRSVSRLHPDVNIDST